MIGARVGSLTALVAESELLAQPLELSVVIEVTGTAHALLKIAGTNELVN